jgi:hypothetical protein
MDVQANALTAAASTQPTLRTSVLARRFAVLGFVVAAVLLLWAIAIATPLVAFLIAVAVAVGWCLWLEKHPEHPTGEETRPSKSDHQ